ncbi:MULTISPECIES: hypothetical protein [Actinomadura]|uniref:Secreted protein n=1 Tax=Actinomadura yumaensis TaxID=111807 RepID=A0ABW2CG86_9ACTN|nr:hypothetical protein [Actinomadura sp. J1-007]MWK39884.1 hypothetical protein [Actinomadura sp. J1-007]
MRTQRTKAAGIALALAAAGTVSLAAAPVAVAAESKAATPDCYSTKGRTWGRGHCTTRGNYLWKVEVWCTLGASNSSGTMRGLGSSPYVYCPWGRVNAVSITHLS